MAVKRRRNAPHAAASLTKLSLLRWCVFVQSIRRIGDNRLDTAGFPFIEPVKRLSMDESGFAKSEGSAERLFRWLEEGQCRSFVACR